MRSSNLRRIELATRGVAPAASSSSDTLCVKRGTSGWVGAAAVAHGAPRSFARGRVNCFALAAIYADFGGTRWRSGAGNGLRPARRIRLRRSGAQWAGRLAEYFDTTLKVYLECAVEFSLSVCRAALTSRGGSNSSRTRDGICTYSLWMGPCRTEIFAASLFIGLFSILR
jgi:hypothetical protein